jgi:acyl-[acyl-carrier-protein]-phospholipid O-acyltransferase/long-chain-fatty-acid--[acyl-carrier-protein] ligase
VQVLLFTSIFLVGLLTLALGLFALFVICSLWRGKNKHPSTWWIYFFLQTALLILVRLLYRLRVVGIENMPKEGGVLLVCNHVSYVDVVILGVISPRPIRFLSFEGFERSWITRFIMRTMRTIPVAESKAKDAIHKASDALKAGEVVCIFPEGHVTRNGGILPLSRGFELIARRANVPIMPVAIDGLWGSIFSFRGGKFFWKLPKHFRRPVSVVWGQPFAATEHETTRLKLLELASTAFALRPSLQGHLAEDVVRGLMMKGNSTALIDRTEKRKKFSGYLILTLSWFFAQTLKKSTSKKRVAIVLPPGIGAAIANTACVLADKVPVNINFTLGRTQAQHCLKQADVDCVISSTVFREKLNEKFPDFPWLEHFIDIGDALQKIKRWKIAGWLGLLPFLPTRLACSVLRVPRRGGDNEAALLFTSGSSGDPKGVVLSHRNLLANLRQIEDADILPDHSKLLANLPVFHSFGFTVGIWYALSRETVLITTPSPLDTVACINAIKEEGATITVGTPTFLRPYLRRATKDDLRTLEWVVAGAEKLPEDLVQGFADELDTPMLEGYGITEASPVISVNVPNQFDDQAPQGVWQGHQVGSVGRPLIGIAVRFRDVDTNKILAPGETGLLEVRGANIFSQYLSDPHRTREALVDGWYRTGDLARMDDNGFLYLAGRLSRFSKIGGEMVPHGTVEQAIMKVLNLEGTAEIILAVSSQVDAQKGEQLVVLHTTDLDIETVRKGLITAGLPNLWIPKVFKKVPKIPILGTGKLDLNTLKQLAGG